MAEGFNQCVFSGNLTSDAVDRSVGENTVTAYSVAVNGRRDGETLYVRCDHWNAGKVSDFLVKGKPVLVSGDIKLDEWQTKEGESRVSLKLTVRKLQLLGTGRQEPADELAEIF
jgi:single-strand DNA-binding protein